MKKKTLQAIYDPKNDIFTVRTYCKAKGVTYFDAEIMKSELDETIRFFIELADALDLKFSYKEVKG